MTAGRRKGGTSIAGQSIAAGWEPSPLFSRIAAPPGPHAANPSGTNGTVTKLEDVLYVFSQADFGFSDGSGDNDQFAGVLISTEPVNGNLAFDGSAIGAGSFISAADIAAGRLTFESAQNASGLSYASFTFRVRDSAGETDSSPNTITVNVTAVNDAPVYANFNSGSAGTFTEGQANPIFLDFMHNGEVSDIDSADFAGGFLRVSITLNGVPAEDRLAIANGGAVTISGTAAGSTVSVNGVVIGTIAAGGTGIGEDLVIDLNAAADAARTQLLVRALTYANTNQEGPSQASRTVAITLNDGDGPQLGTTTVQAHIMGLNDAPVLTDPSQSQVSYVPGNAPVAMWAGVTVVDPDGQASFSGGNLQMFGGGSGAVIDLIGARFVHQNAGGMIFILDTTTGQLIGELSLFFGRAQVFNLTAAATPSVINALVQSFGFHTEGANPAMGNFQASMTFFDGNSGGFGGGLTSNMIFQTISVGSPAPLPIVDLNGNGPGVDSAVLYTENGTPTAIGTSIFVLDANGGNQIDRATVTLNSVLAGDTLTYGALPAGVTAVVTTPPNQIVITFTGAATPQAYTTLIASIRYASTSENPLGNRFVTVTVESGTDVSAAAQTQIFINAVDDPSIAHDDQFATGPSGVLNGNLFADNGFGADSDPDTVPLVTAVNGVGGGLGVPFTLPSGALLTVNGNGTFAYDPNDAFGGAAATDVFTYTLQGGSMATVTIHVVALGGSVISGTPGGDYLVGTPGGDQIFGLGGNDVLDGIGGADQMTGGAGDDIYVVDHAGDIVTELANEGQDTVYAFTSYVLTGGSHVETLSVTDHNLTTAINLFGNEFAQNVFGNAGANILDGGGGADAMVGFGGNDIFVVDHSADIAFEFSNQGNDTVYVTTSYMLNGGSEIETLSAQDNNSTNVINLTGNEYNNIIYGNAGINILNGLAGADAMIGFGGNDIFIVDNAADIAFEFAGQGSDTVYTSTSYMLNGGSEIETLSASDNGATVTINLTGNEYANTLYGNGGVNLLNGLGGADAMIGFGGNDIFIVDSAGDIAFEFAGQGSDTVYALTSYALTGGSEVETLSVADIGATVAITLTGNEYGNGILGNNGANIIDGKGGFDWLYGFGGADSFAFTTALAGNIDVITDFSAADDTILLENAIFTGLAAGALGANAFVVGSAALDADDRIIYNQATGALLFDADGNGAGAAVQFAQLLGAPVLTASDFTVI